MSLEIINESKKENKRSKTRRVSVAKSKNKKKYTDIDSDADDEDEEEEDEEKGDKEEADEDEVEEEEEPEYEVECIVKHRKSVKSKYPKTRDDGERCMEYRVKWKGWDESTNTWEHETELTQCQKLVDKYW